MREQTQVGALRVLFIEDNGADVELCRQALRKGGLELQEQVTDRPDQFQQLLSRETYDLILADYNLPGWNAADALRFLHEQGKDVPLIVVTGALGDEKAVECIKEGAWDYVLKEHLDRLPYAVGRALAEAGLRRRHQLVEAELRRLNRALLALTRCHQAMVEASEERSLLQAICDLLVDVGGYRFAWAGYPLHDEYKTVQPMAYAEVDSSYLQELDVRWDESEHGCGPTGTAIRSGQACVVTSTMEDPRFLPWRQKAMRHGFGSCVAVPLFGSDGKVFGSLNIYAAQEDAFQDEEMQLLIELAGDLAYGISALRAREAQEQAEAELRKKTVTLQGYAAELERSNAELQDFASIASHDLQEPLRKVIAFGDRLAEHCAAALDDTGRDCLQRMQGAARRMSDLVQALLEYSRVGTRVPPSTAVDLAQVMLGVLGDLEFRVRETQGCIQVGSLPVVKADASGMRQVLQNLLSNALKFRRPEVPPQIVVEAFPAAEGRWEIAISDNGIGFDEKHLVRIFRPFQRLHTRNEYEGTGMGLAICRKIVARHGGTVRAHSEPGHGSTFILTLQAARLEEEAACNPIQRPAPLCSLKTTTMTSC